MPHDVKGSTARAQKDLCAMRSLTIFTLLREDDPVHKLFTRGLADQEKCLHSEHTRHWHCRLAMVQSSLGRQQVPPETVLFLACARVKSIWPNATGPTTDDHPFWTQCLVGICSFWSMVQQHKTAVLEVYLPK